MVEINQTKCELAGQIVYHPVYRLSQFWTLFVSVSAVPSLFYFLLKRIFKLSFHGNLKCLLTTYFVCIFLYAVVLTFDFTYHCIVPFFVTSNCGLIIDETLYKYGHFTSLFLLTTPMLLPFGFTIERFVAIGLAHRYESIRTLMGPIFCFALVCFHQNKYLQKKTTLSLRYALEEISQSSKFTLIVTFTHLLFFGTYTTASILVRELGQSFFGSYLNWSVARGVNCAVPTYNLLITFIGTKSLKHLNSKRKTMVWTTVQMRQKGREGAMNYENITMKPWNTVSGRISLL
uniref:Serpentine Receptor, class T n=1 Tax=Caenorhabditis tropicalis TaxID=1561998 RepID=A0A1I7U8L6_9PELO